MTKTARYLKTFFEEKQLQPTCFEVEGKSGMLNIIESDVVISAIHQAPPIEQDHIARAIRRIDFMNGDINHFLGHLAQALAI